MYAIRVCTNNVQRRECSGFPGVTRAGGGEAEVLAAALGSVQLRGVAKPQAQLMFT